MKLEFEQDDIKYRLTVMSDGLVIESTKSDWKSYLNKFRRLIDNKIEWEQWDFEDMPYLHRKYCEKLISNIAFA